MNKEEILAIVKEELAAEEVYYKCGNPHCISSSAFIIPIKFHDKMVCKDCGGSAWEARKKRSDEIIAEAIADKVKDEWIFVDDQLPEIQEGRFGTYVLAIDYDPCWTGTMLNRPSVHQEFFRKKDGFKMTSAYGFEKDGKLTENRIERCDPIILWKPMPKSPSAEEIIKLLQDRKWIGEEES
jgi:hypothetical protein